MKSKIACATFGILLLLVSGASAFTRNINVQVTGYYYFQGNHNIINQKIPEDWPVTVVCWNGMNRTIIEQADTDAQGWAVFTDLSQPLCTYEITVAYLEDGLNDWKARTYTIAPPQASGLQTIYAKIYTSEMLCGLKGRVMSASGNVTNLGYVIIYDDDTRNTERLQPHYTDDSGSYTEFENLVCGSTYKLDAGYRTVDGRIDSSSQYKISEYVTLPDAFSTVITHDFVLPDLGSGTVTKTLWQNITDYMNTLHSMYLVMVMIILLAAIALLLKVLNLI